MAAPPPSYQCYHWHGRAAAWPRSYPSDLLQFVRALRRDPAACLWAEPQVVRDDGRHLTLRLVRQR